jgi:hypothetical protein
MTSNFEATYDDEFVVKDGSGRNFTTILDFSDSMVDEILTYNSKIIPLFFLTFAPPAFGGRPEDKGFKRLSLGPVGPSFDCINLPERPKSSSDSG